MLQIEQSLVIQLIVEKEYVTDRTEPSNSID